MGIYWKKEVSFLLALALAMSLAHAANCVNPCVNTDRPQACFTIGTVKKDGKTAPEQCCPSSGPYGSGTGLFGIPCPQDQNDCLMNYWEIPDSECNPIGCCFAPQYLEHSCLPYSMEPIMCREMLNGTDHEGQCEAISDGKCEMGCCCFFNPAIGDWDSDITFGANCTKRGLPDATATFIDTVKSIDDCRSRCSFGTEEAGVTGNIDDWEVGLNRDGVYLSSRLICLHDSRGDARVVAEKNDFAECEVTGYPCPDYENYGTGSLTCNSTCNVSFSWDINWNDPYKLRFEGVSSSEGGCRIAAKTVHYEYIDCYDCNIDNSNDEFNTQVTWKSPDSAESGPHWKPRELFMKIVSWDNIGEQCSVIGGDWLTDAKAAQLGVNANSFNGFRCCGDDWIWVNNRAVSYSPGITTPTLQQKINAGTACLYGGQVDTKVSSGIVQEYKCKPSNEEGSHVSYDNALQYDDEGQERTFAAPDMGFYFTGLTGFDETDVGKWTGGAGEKLYCRYHFDNSAGKGDMFQWMTIGQAGELGPIECELHLGYNWTGTKCCGNNPGETFNDAAPECNAQDAANYALNSVPYTSRQFEQEFKLKCDDSLTRNGACWQGKFASENTVVAGNSAQPHKLNIMATDGILIGCKDRNGASPITDQTLLSTGSSNHDKCAFVANHVCAYSNDSWIKRDNNAESLAVKMLGYNSNKEGVKESVLPYNPSSRECCFSGSCWNGTKCVWGSNAVYYYESGAFKEFPANEWKDYQGKDIYSCQNSTWARSEPQFNWFHDPTQLNFCSQPYSCLCAKSATTPYDYSCWEGAVDGNNCLIQPNMFKGDHYCQSAYSGSDIVSSKWTTRTKMMALQMISIAGGSDYALFCDRYSNSVNYPVPLEMIENNINSVCTMTYQDKVVIGVSLNPTEGNPMGFDAKPILFNPSNGLIDQVLGEGASVPQCNNAIQTADDSKHGTYKRCVQQSDKIWYNNKTKSLIYSKTGLASIAEPDWNAADASLGQMAKPILDHASTNKAQIESGENAKPGIGMIQNARDFGRLYIAKKGGKQIFGFVETKYDAEFTLDLRNVIGVTYSGFSSIDCEDITHAYPGSYCGTQGGRLVVLDKGPTEFELWQDLTSKVRIS